ncbi:uncharacterized protein LOC120346153 [Styela clava]|uniref:uncharacterized protein LOC120346153 n=1 Tax=Styela clava TaxID=7725 RepID=UPI001939CE29|nr:uncharacterized protein LOC120346153 [Styela clava]
METSYALCLIIAALICKTFAQIPDVAQQHLPCPSPDPYPPICDYDQYSLFDREVRCDMLHVSLSPPSSCTYEKCYVPIPIPDQPCPYIVYGYNCRSGNYPNGCTNTNTCQSTYKCVQVPYSLFVYTIPYCECGPELGIPLG